MSYSNQIAEYVRESVTPSINDNTTIYTLDKKFGEDERIRVNLKDIRTEFPSKQGKITSLTSRLEIILELGSKAKITGFHSEQIESTEYSTAEEYPEFIDSNISYLTVLNSSRKKESNLSSSKAFKLAYKILLEE